jgi:hypothetical protein
MHVCRRRPGWVGPERNRYVPGGAAQRTSRPPERQGYGGGAYRRAVDGLDKSWGHAAAAGHMGVTLRPATVGTPTFSPSPGRPPGQARTRRAGVPDLALVSSRFV